MSISQNIIGNKYGRLTVTAGGGTLRRKAAWLCECECGAKVIAMGNALKTGNTKSCGCYFKETLGKRATVHGLNKTPEHRAWVGMRQRCNNSNNPGYKWYGERGIKICDRWESFESFYADMGTKPTPDHTLDRIDVNGGYSPDNCRWATAAVQSRNQRNSPKNKTGCSGVTIRSAYGVARYRVRISTNGEKLTLGTYDNYMDAVFVRKVAEALYWGKIYKPDY